jgi:hypothetical protein
VAVIHAQRQANEIRTRAEREAGNLLKVTVATGTDSFAPVGTGNSDAIGRPLPSGHERRPQRNTPLSTINDDG